jgi:hypothetical protein
MFVPPLVPPLIADRKGEVTVTWTCETMADQINDRPRAIGVMMFYLNDTHSWSEPHGFSPLAKAFLTIENRIGFWVTFVGSS